MRAPFFYGEYELTIDPKNRLLVPADVRKRIDPVVHGDAFFVTLVNDVPWFYPELYYEEFVNARVPLGIAPHPSLVMWEQLRISLACRVDWDSQGRVVLPDSLIQRAKLEKKVCLVGRRDHLELWNQPAWAAQRQDLLVRSSVIEMMGQQMFATQAAVAVPTSVAAPVAVAALPRHDQ